ncbi:alpha/beta hydrolase-fold protein [Shewanella violacea]|nr:alpha/beta hydrolase-fold protein [Shewanella violacea]
MHRFIRYLTITISLVIFSSYALGINLQKNEGIISGGKYSIQSLVLDEVREIFISLPESYKYSSHHYPVIYVMDGEFLFDLTRSMVEIRAARNYMPESIIVGIPNNTGKRIEMALELFDDKGNPFFYGDGLGQTGKYLKFFRNDLIPTIEEEFRVNSHRTIIGMSPSFGPVLQAFWSEPDLFTGYIVLAAEIGKKLKSGKSIGERLIEEISDEKRSTASIYIGTAGRDIIKRGPKEAALYVDIPKKLKNIANPKIRYKFEVIHEEDHYGMSIPGIQHGLETIYAREIWNIDYRKMWNSQDPAQALSDRYQQLSEHYGFEIIPLEKSFNSIHNIIKTAEILYRQNRIEKLIPWLQLAVEYYPYSPRIYSQLSKAYTQAGKHALAIIYAEKAVKLAQNSEDIRFYKSLLKTLTP